MSILLDQGAREAIQHRRERGKEASITLCVTSLRGGGHTVSAAWGHEHGSEHLHLVQQAEDARCFSIRALPAMRAGAISSSPAAAWDRSII